MVQNKFEVLQDQNNGDDIHVELVDNNVDEYQEQELIISEDQRRQGGQNQNLLLMKDDSEKKSNVKVQNNLEDSQDQMVSIDNGNVAEVELISVEGHEDIVNSFQELVKGQALQTDDLEAQPKIVTDTLKVMDDHAGTTQCELNGIEQVEVLDKEEDVVIGSDLIPDNKIVDSIKECLANISIPDNKAEKDSKVESILEKEQATHVLSANVSMNNDNGGDMS
ncbi:uncharacterized protein LOC132056775 [Lycium ferocissimum]|uniref:uncharacterized protein LOC132056775 n=1 Tax=Lycium ferocissimum TaxID=112874 RepID=UPI0028154081|nr:uncharacterized protein LOC132056775 [Lycium ferocissimum]XP_059305101.1 uncharacterized protein LOC132056775 [Lycium ferocissimum]XP_059305102.1 uncharacterized protein LOC132056775 [Lycium ferocissimum]XP_059305103.1 uncharacterized protein LOC132056775 [Lycium ferocissimum]XP_059305104.1 uncharacterized protein LOC132056775 [Lycium ferocissimum]XP_059305105.1 uncharacterized protein LOC132056775 [Lycium ferocissimum]XP_059305106.1 uncharacterized protein LOC132056775 [Lycium ferocissimu